MALAKSEFDNPNYGNTKNVKVTDYTNPFDAVAEYLFFLSAIVSILSKVTLQLF